MLIYVSRKREAFAEFARVLRGSRARGTLDRWCQSERRNRRVLERSLGDPEFWAKYQRLYSEMFEQLAPASEGPAVNPGRKRLGRLVFGGDAGKRR